MVCDLGNDELKEEIKRTRQFMHQSMLDNNKILDDSINTLKLFANGK